VSRGTACEGTPAAAGRPATAPFLALCALAAAVALAALAGAAPGDAAAKPRKAKLDLILERTPVLAKDAYKRLPPMGKRGAMGGNLEGSSFEVADQNLGDLYVRAGLVYRNRKLIKRGFRAFDYAFKRQRGDGSLPEDQTEGYAFFVQAVAHSALLMRKTKYKRTFRGKLRRYEERLERAAVHMIAPSAWAGFKSRNPRYTHSGYTTGTALTLTGKLGHSRTLVRYGRRAIKQALDNQRRNGVNPELGGYDVRYQMAGLLYAERYRVYFPGGKLTRRVERMTNRGLKWMKRRVAGNGYIKWRGSSRACRELNSNGNPKTPGYAFAVRGFAYWGALNRREGLIKTARSIDRYAHYAPGDTLCTSKKKIKPRRKRGRDRGGRGGDGGGPGGGLIDRLLDPVRQNDLLE
jgi:hypothetical protein